MKILLALSLCFAMLLALSVPFSVGALTDGGTLNLDGSNSEVAFVVDESKPRQNFTAEWSYAVVLRELGLFRGVSETNFDLERAPSRLEALVMLIRVYGKENEALETKPAHPFTDVPEWASPYIGYAYAQGWTKGSSATTFGMGDASCATYLTFMLRSLGYSDADGDFAWDAPFDLAKTVGILNGEVYTKNFLRADLVTVSLYALRANLKGSTQTLADKLMAAGVFAKETYDKYMDFTKVDITCTFDAASNGGLDIRTVISVMQALDPRHTYRVVDDSHYTITITELERLANLAGTTSAVLTEQLKETFAELIPEFSSVFVKLEISEDYKTATLTVNKAAYLASPAAAYALPLSMETMLEEMQSFALLPVAERSVTVRVVSETGEQLN